MSRKEEPDIDPRNADTLIAKQLWLTGKENRSKMTMSKTFWLTVFISNRFQELLCLCAVHSLCPSLCYSDQPSPAPPVQPPPPPPPPPYVCLSVCRDCLDSHDRQTDRRRLPLEWMMLFRTHTYIWYIHNKYLSAEQRLVAVVVLSVVGSVECLVIRVV